MCPAGPRRQTRRLGDTARTYRGVVRLAHRSCQLAPDANPLRLGGVDEVTEHVARAAELARAAAPRLAAAEDAQLDAALAAIAEGLEREGAGLIAASADEVAAAEGKLSPAVIDRLRLDEARLEGMVAQVRELASLPAAPRTAGRITLDGGLEVEERRIPVGVIGANYEAR